MFNPNIKNETDEDVSRKILEMQYKREYMTLLSIKEFLSVDEAAFYFDLDRKIIAGYCIESKYKNNFPCIYVNGTEKPKIHREGAKKFFKELAQLTASERKLKIKNISEVKEELEQFLQRRPRRGRPRKIIT